MNGRPGRVSPRPGPLPAGLSRDQLIAEVARGLGPVPHGARAVVAVSGGPDSTALAYLSAEARPDLLLVLGHVRHGLRDDRADVAAVGQLARNLGVPLEVVEVTVAGSAGLEAAARRARYDGLRQVAERVAADHLLVGHTADDQAETLLLRMARGTGIDGLAGMAPVRAEGALVIVRPLLRIRRGDVWGFLDQEGLEAVDDPMNRDPAFARVRARNEALPALERLGGDPVGALGRLADLARSDARALQELSERHVGAVVRRYGPARIVAGADLTDLGPGLARRVVRTLLADVRGDAPPPTAAHVERVLALQPGEAVDLPGAVVTCGGGWLAAVPASLPPARERPLAVPGRTPWPPADVHVVAAVPGERGDGQLTLAVGGGFLPVAVPPTALPPGGGEELAQVVLPADLGDRLVVRARRPGDRLRLPVGGRKLQDVLVDAGVPRAVRDLLPVIATADRVVWVPGVAVDADLARAGRTAPGVHLAVQ